MPLQTIRPQLLELTGAQQLRSFQAFSGATILTGQGITMTATGNVAAYTAANTNQFTATPAMEFLITAPAATAVAGFRHNALFFTRGAIGATGGFALQVHWKTAIGQTIATHRAFVGAIGSAAAPTDVNPSTLLNTIGMGWDAADTNVHIIHNDGTGAATKINLGANFPRPNVDRANMYILTLIASRNVNEVHYMVTNLNNGAVATGTLTTDLPAANQLLTVLGYASVGGTNSVIGIGLSAIQLATNVAV